MGNRELHILGFLVACRCAHLMEPVALVSFQDNVPLLPGAVHGKAVDQDMLLVLAEYLEGSPCEDVVRIAHFVL